MCGMPAEPGVQVNLVANIFSCVCNQPIDDRSRVAMSPVLFFCAEIVDVQHLSPGEELGCSKAGNAFYFTFMPQCEHLIGVHFLSLNLSQERIFGEMRA